jgi:hypothetical protein
MNAKDIEAARRLIAQFEGRVTGRHNSGQFRPNVRHQISQLESPRRSREREITRSRNDEIFLLIQEGHPQRIWNKRDEGWMNVRLEAKLCEVGECTPLRAEHPQPSTMLNPVMLLPVPLPPRFRDGYELSESFGFMDFEFVWVNVRGVLKGYWRRR